MPLVSQLVEEGLCLLEVFRGEVMSTTLDVQSSEREACPGGLEDQSRLDHPFETVLQLGTRLVVSGGVEGR